MNIGIIKIGKSNIAAFCIGFFGVVVMFFLKTIDFHPAEWIRPIVSNFQIGIQKKADSNILPRLQKIKSTYRIKGNSTFIARAQAAQDFDQAKAYGAINFDTGDVIIGKNLSEKLPIASLTKIMSAVVALDLAGPDDLLTVSEDASQVIPTKIGVIPGQKMKLSELLNAALMTSANDAVQVIKDGIDGRFGPGTFIYAMNAKAQSLGLQNTSFQNPQGFDSDKNFSTVEDLAKLSHYAISNYPLIAKIASQDYTLLPQDQNHKRFDLYNWNGLLDVYPGTVGLKIGNTDLAGYTTVVLSRRSNENILAIVLGAPGVLERDLWASELLDLSYQETKSLTPVGVTNDMLLAKYRTWHYWN